ncbi:unnamed protein product [Dicrocoelium dendriticum]|nr:unnamed protein product [Dicrocoelium dendriticum]
MTNNTFAPCVTSVQTFFPVILLVVPQWSLSPTLPQCPKQTSISSKINVHFTLSRLCGLHAATPPSVMAQIVPPPRAAKRVATPRIVPLHRCSLHLLQGFDG